MANANIYTGADGSISLSSPEGLEGEKAQAVIDAAPADMTDGDWLEVALAAIDQAGFPLRDQGAIGAILRASFERRTAREVVS
mgnify:CR=1 FL=1